MTDGESSRQQAPDPPSGGSTAAASIGRVVAGLVLGGGALWLSFHGFQLGDLFSALHSLDWYLTSAALASTLLTLVVGAWRWRWLFYPRQSEVPLPVLFMGIVVGQMVNILSPVRVGELARVYAVAEKGRLSKAHVLATVALEKVLDLVMFAAAVVVLLGVIALPPGVRVKTSAQLGAAATAFVLLWAATRFGLPLARLAEQRVPALPSRWREVGSAIVHRFLDGLVVLQRPRVGGILVAQSVLLMFSSALTNYLLIEAFRLPVPAWSALFLLVLLQVGAVPPSLPGKLGVFNYLIVVGLGAFGVGQVDALNFSIVLYAVALLPKVVLGAAYFVSGSIPLRSTRQA